MPQAVPIPGSSRSRLIEVAIKHFQARGYEGVSVVEMAEEAGVTTGSLYHHFGSKRGLYGAIREEMEKRMTERMEGAAAAVGGGRPGIKAALEVSFDAAVRFGVTRILAEPHPEGSPDPVVDLLGDLLTVLVPKSGTASIPLAAAWRGALMAVADGTEARSVRAGLSWVLSP